MKQTFLSGSSVLLGKRSTAENSKWEHGSSSGLLRFVCPLGY